MGLELGNISNTSLCLQRTFLKNRHKVNIGSYQNLVSKREEGHVWHKQKRN